jgi:hypothetical protein
MAVDPSEIHFYKIQKIDERDIDFYRRKGVNIGFRADSYKRNDSIYNNNCVCGILNNPPHYKKCFKSMN